MSHHNQSTLRRSAHHPKPPQPPQPPSQQQSVQAAFQATQHELASENDPPPPPAPSGGIGSNSSTPRGSLEHLPPPPPHLLQSDDEIDASPANRIRGVSVAESVKALQKSGHTPCSPKSLRRAHSVSSSPFQRQLGVSMSGPAGGHQRPPQQQQHQEQEIYAPVAHLQQKMQMQQQQQQLRQQQQQQQMSPEGDKYGFGMQFQAHQSQFYQQMVDGGVPMQSPPEAHPAGSTFGVGQQQQQKYGSAAHDQIMRDIDAKMRGRPQPPPMAPGGGGAAAGPARQQSYPGQQPNYDDQTAQRVRRWIESRSVTDVKECRPVLNREIQQGFALRKAKVSNDRSAPRF